MSSAIEQRLAARGLELPEAPAPAANYVPYTISGRLLFVAGQLPFRDGQVAVVGRLGEDVSLEQGQEAARICALNLLAQAKAAWAGGNLGGVSLDHLARSFQGSQVGLAPLAQVLGEAQPGWITRTTLAAYEGLMFGLGLALGLAGVADAAVGLAGAVALAAALAGAACSAAGAIRSAASPRR